MPDPIQILNEIAQQVKNCQNCELQYSRENAVPGAGPADSEIMLIGEGPGFHENRKGVPFVGQAGAFLDELLQTVGFTRDQVFITNVVKCRPPGNRDPLPAELSACSQYLDKQIQVINPLVIVTLGRFSMARFFPNGKISQIHGQPGWKDGRLIIPMYHPAAALHQGRLRPTLLEDFGKIPGWIEDALQRRPEFEDMQDVVKEEDVQDDAEQLSLF